MRVPPRSTDAPLGSPLFLLNLKTYPVALGAASVRIARWLERAGHDAGVAVAIAPAQPDLAHVAQAVAIPVLGQHVDPVEPGAATGSVPAEAICAAGARGSLVNHSEHPLELAEVASALARLQRCGLTGVVCAATTRRSAALARFRPPYLAVEPPELIGGTRSVSTARPQVVLGTVRAVAAVSPRTSVLCGAGVHDRKDVAKALELGSAGVLVASAVTRARDPRQAIAELLAGY